MTNTNLHPTPTHPVRALVTGATGALGPTLVRRLVEAGYQVTVLVRQPPPGLWPAGVKQCRGDITDRPAVLAATANVDVIFHLAAKLHINQPGAELAPAYERVNVQGTRHIMEAAQINGVRRVVFFSSICVYGPTTPPRLLDEQSPLRPDTLYARSKQRAEALVLAANRPGSGQPLGVVLRLGAVYGPRIKGNYARLVTALRRGRFVPVGPGANRRTLVFEQDVAAAAVLAASHPRAAGQIYNVTGGETPTFNQIVAAICHGLQRPQPRWRLPVVPVRLALGAIEGGYRLLGHPPRLGRFTLDKLLEDVAISGQKLEQELGFRPAFTLKQGWQTTIAQMDF